jgi:hypothetical protein
MFVHVETWQDGENISVMLQHPLGGAAKEPNLEFLNSYMKLGLLA